MKLTNRLACIASKVPQNSIVADIGTDHAYIPVFIVENKISKKVIASDVNKGPLEKAQKHIKANGFEEYIETRLGSGLKILRPGEADTIIVAGMGGMLIREILDQSKEVLDTINTLILQPMMAQDVLREWLCRNNFTIVDESLAREGDKIYTIIVAKLGYEEVDEIYSDIGKRLVEKNDPLLRQYLQQKINELKNILTKLSGQETSNVVERKRECEKKLKWYEGLLSQTNSIKRGE